MSNAPARKVSEGGGSGARMEGGNREQLEQQEAYEQCTCKQGE